LMRNQSFERKPPRTTGQAGLTSREALSGYRA
jgi:hypothetical protein